MARYLYIDNLKGIGVLIMVFAHSWLYFTDQAANAGTTEHIIYILSRFCAPAFVICYSFVICRPSTSRQISKRLGYILGAAFALSALLFFYSQGTFPIHILYSFLLVTLLVPILRQIKIQLLIALTFILYILHILINLFVTETTAAMAYFTHGPLSAQATLSYGVLWILPWTLIGVILNTTHQNLSVKVKRNLPIALVLCGSGLLLMEILLSRTYTLRELIGADLLAVGIIIYSILFNKVLFSSDLINAMGRRVLAWYLVHHVYLIIAASWVGHTIAYDRMMHQSLVNEVSNPVKMLIVFAVFLVTGLTLTLINRTLLRQRP